MYPKIPSNDWQNEATLKRLKAELRMMKEIRVSEAPALAPPGSRIAGKAERSVGLLSFINAFEHERQNAHKARKQHFGLFRPCFGRNRLPPNVFQRKPSRPVSGQFVLNRAKSCQKNPDRNFMKPMSRIAQIARPSSLPAIVSVVASAAKSEAPRRRWSQTMISLVKTESHQCSGSRIVCKIRCMNDLQNSQRLSRSYYSKRLKVICWRTRRAVAFAAKADEFQARQS